MPQRPDAERPVTATDLEQERLRTYIDWAEVRAPAWYWPAYALVIALWLVGYGLGPLWGAAGALLVALFAGFGLRVVFDRSQVGMPRFRGMPAPLKRAYLPAVGAALLLVGVLVFLAIADSPPHLLLGLLTGPLMALAGAWASRRYRVEARRLAEEVGMAR